MASMVHAAGFEPDRSGMVFRADKLYRYGRDRVTVFRGGWMPAFWCWSERGARLSSSRWHAEKAFAEIEVFRPRGANTASQADFCNGYPVLANGQLLLPLDVEARHTLTAVTSFLRTVPEDILRRIAPLHLGTWPLYVFLARFTGALDLFDGNPALALALARLDELGRGERPLGTSMRALVARRQRDILACLGFPGTQSAVRTMAKVRLESLSVTSILELRSILGEDARGAELCRHARWLDAQLIGAIHKESDIVTMPLLEEIMDGGDTGYFAYLLEDVGRLRRELRCRVAPICSTARLHQVHTELDRRHEGANAMCNLPELFPAPPLVPRKSTIRIEPIETPRELVREGMEQHNCVLSYAPAIVQGTRYVYRVVAPVRATLVIVNECGRWHLDDILGPCNQPVPARIRREAVATLFAGGPRTKARMEGKVACEAECDRVAATVRCEEGNAPG